MEVSVLGDSACTIKGGQLFIAEKSSVEGRDKAVLKQVKTADNRSKQQKISELIYFLRDDGEQMPDELISGMLVLAQNFERYVQSCPVHGIVFQQGETKCDHCEREKTQVESLKDDIKETMQSLQENET